MSDLPLNLTILRMVQEYGKIPRGLIYDKVAASNTEIDQQVLDLTNRGALKVEGDDIVIGDATV
jgi:hypothetical protein